MKKSLFAVLLLTALVFLLASVFGQAPASIKISRIVAGETAFRVVRLAGNLSNPWGLAFLPEGGMLVTERNGTIVHILPDGRITRLSLSLPIYSSGQGGLLDIALHPRFAENRYVYVTFVVFEGGYPKTALARTRFADGKFGAPERLWTMKSRSQNVVHFGSRLAFAPDGTLFLSTGDRNMRELARMPMEDAGKLLRLTDTGKAAPDNPFAGKKGYLPEIYSLGHRNIQGLALHPVTGDIWLTEHGPKGGDELNLVVAGADYGWPLVTFGLEYSGAQISKSPYAPGIAPPVLHWTPSIAPSGLTFYYGKDFPAWEGNLLSGSLVGQKLVRLVLERDTVKSQEVLIDGKVGRIRDVRVGPDGLVYLLTDAAQGELLRLEPVR